jgi:hypothetical protein
MARGFQFVGEGQVGGKGDFKPKDSERSFPSVQIDYMGGSMRFETTRENYEKAQVGAVVKFKACVFDKKGVAKCELLNIENKAAA